jgi:aminobenzoyl-glutamate transport protein
MKRLLAHLVLALVLAEVFLVLASWLLSATMAGNVRSLLSSEGVRWFFGGFTTMLASPWLVWLVLLAIAGGCLWQSGIVSIRLPLSSLHYRQRVALRTALILMLIYIAAILALTLVPHAVLLSATGRLFPSPFSRAFVPIVSFGVLLVSVAYGWASGSFRSIASIVSAMSTGIAAAAPLFILYVVFVQFYESLRFVFF